MHQKLFVAGTFDQFHIGHQYVLWQGSSMAREMVIIIARDETVKRIKKQHPRNKEQDRLRRVEKERINNAVVRLGRPDANFWQTLLDEAPDAILLGYDQRFDEEQCKRFFPDLKIIRSKPYFPEFFKSSRFR